MASDKTPLGNDWIESFDELENLPDGHPAKVDVVDINPAFTAYYDKILGEKPAREAERERLGGYPAHEPEGAQSNRLPSDYARTPPTPVKHPWKKKRP